MWEKVGVEKDARGHELGARRHRANSPRRCCPTCGSPTRENRANYEWLDAIDVVNMIDACELIIHSSLERKESRGPFFRTDFPLTDNDNWLVANVLKKSGNGMRFEQRPYDLPFFQPGFRHETISRLRGEPRSAPPQSPAPPAGSVRPSSTIRSRRAIRALSPGDPHRRADSPLRRTAVRAIRISRCLIRNGCAFSMLSTGSPRTRPPISPIAGSAAPRCAGPAPCG